MYIYIYRIAARDVFVLDSGDRAAEPDFGWITFALWFSSGMKSSLSPPRSLSLSRSLALSLSRSLCNLSRPDCHAGTCAAPCANVVCSMYWPHHSPSR